MTAQQRDKIARFEPFSQADTSTTRRFGGTGLGLRISNTLAEMLGSGIQIESEQGVGSCFSFSIDTGDLQGVDRIEQEAISSYAASKPRRRAEAVNQPEVLTGVRVLLVEDGKDNQRLIRFHLEKAGAQVELAENGRVAVDRLHSPGESLPDLVLMDMQMPEMDGYTATRILRQRGMTLPIIALTAHAMDGDREQCLQAGCNEYLTKPIDKDKLKAMCLQMLATPSHRDIAML